MNFSKTERADVAFSWKEKEENVRDMGYAPYLIRDFTLGIKVPLGPLNYHDREVTFQGPQQYEMPSSVPFCKQTSA